MGDWTRSTRLSGPDLALLDQIGERGRGHDHDIDRLPAFEAQRNGVMRRSHGGAELGHKLVVRGVFIFGDQFQIGGRERAGSHHLDLGRAHRGDGKKGAGQGQGQTPLVMVFMALSLWTAAQSPAWM